jgi:hypothetical protein
LSLPKADQIWTLLSGHGGPTLAIAGKELDKVLPMAGWPHDVHTGWSRGLHKVGKELATRVGQRAGHNVSHKD